jgi:hypothetical protein
MEEAVRELLQFAAHLLRAEEVAAEHLLGKRREGR